MVLGIVLLFVLLGPAIGYAVSFGYIDNFGSGVALALLPFGYPLALWYTAIPAAGTAVTYWSILRYKTRRNPPLPYRALIGCVLGAVVCTAYAAIVVDGLNVSSMVKGWAAPGAAAGAACASIIINRWYSKLFPDHTEDRHWFLSRK